MKNFDESMVIFIWHRHADAIDMVRVSGTEGVYASVIDPLAAHRICELAPKVFYYDLCKQLAAMN